MMKCYIYFLKVKLIIQKFVVREMHVNVRESKHLITVMALSIALQSAALRGMLASNKSTKIHTLNRTASVDLTSHDLQFVSSQQF